MPESNCAAYTATTEFDIYEILTAEFGDTAADTIVYSYLFRLGKLVFLLCTHKIP